VAVPNMQVEGIPALTNIYTKKRAKESAKSEE
jgi:hypothetical protein